MLSSFNKPSQTERQRMHPDFYRYHSTTGDSGSVYRMGRSTGNMRRARKRDGHREAGNGRRCGGTVDQYRRRHKVDEVFGLQTASDVSVGVAHWNVECQESATGGNLIYRSSIWQLKENKTVKLSLHSIMLIYRETYCPLTRRSIMQPLKGTSEAAISSASTSSGTPPTYRPPAAPCIPTTCDAPTGILVLPAFLSSIYSSSLKILDAIGWKPQWMQRLNKVCGLLFFFVNNQK